MIYYSLFGNTIDWFLYEILLEGISEGYNKFVLLIFGERP